MFKYLCMFNTEVPQPTRSRPTTGPWKNSYRVTRKFWENVYSCDALLFIVCKWLFYIFIVCDWYGAAIWRFHVKLVNKRLLWSFILGLKRMAVDPWYTDRSRPHRSACDSQINLPIYTFKLFKTTRRRNETELNSLLAHCSRTHPKRAQA